MYLTIVILPLIGSIIAGLFGRWIGSKGACVITTTLVGISAVCSLVTVYEVGLSGSPVYIHLGRWMESGFHV